MYIDGTSNGIIDHNIFAVAYGRGITAANSSPVTISNNTFYSYVTDSISSFDIYAVGTHDLVIDGNNFTSTVSGARVIYNTNGAGAKITNNTIHGEGDDFVGIWDQSSSLSNISNNHVTISNAARTQSIDSAILLESSSNASVNNNVLASDGNDYGMSVFNSQLNGTGNTFTGSYLCNDSGGNTGSVNFVGGGHCP